MKNLAKTNYLIIFVVSFGHFLNDVMQSLIVALYPLLKSEFALTFTQIGLITLTFQITASLLQPIVGLYIDKHPKPYSLAFGMMCTFGGLILLGFATNFMLILLSVSILGVGSAIFHPESSRVARMASGGRYGLAQSIFQVGGNVGASIGPLLAISLVLPFGQSSVAYIAPVALLATYMLYRVGTWYKQNYTAVNKKTAQITQSFSKQKVTFVMLILLVLMFSKFFYFASMSSYLVFYLMKTYAIEESLAQLHLFYFLFSIAVGTILGGIIGDIIGRKRVIWLSILGVAPFTLALPYVSLDMSVFLSIIIGFLLASAFPAIVVYAQELLPNRVGAVSGLFFGIAFGLGGIGASVLGYMADEMGIRAVYIICSFLPLLGFVALFLPDLRSKE